MKEDTAICLDIGGTFIKYALVTENGDLFYSSKEETHKTSADNLLEQIINIIHRLKMIDDKYEIKGIGISSAGQVDHRKGRIIHATDNLPGWTGIELGRLISNHFELDCYVENDVNAAALGELHYGNGRSHDDFICITIGTGIGGAIIKDRELIHGEVGSAGEVGHMVIKAGGRKCNCGNRGCYEQYASVAALKRFIKSKLEKDTPAPDFKVEDLIDRYYSDSRIKAAVEMYIENVSIGIVNLLHIFNPPAVIIGGAISANNILIEGIRKRVNSSAMPPFIKSLEILPAQLGNGASLYGVSTYVFGKR